MRHEEIPNSNEATNHTFHRDPSFSLLQLCKSEQFNEQDSSGNGGSIAGTPSFRSQKVPEC